MAGSLDAPQNISPRRGPLDSLLLAAAFMLGIVNLLWLGRSQFWLCDLAASLSTQIALFTLLFALAALAAAIRRVARAFVAAAIALIASLLGVLPVATPRLTADPAAGSSVRAVNVRILQINCNTLNPQGEAIVDLLMRSEADVIGLTESSATLLEAVRTREDFKARYTWTDFPPNAGPGWRLVFSRWPIEKIPGVSDVTFGKVGPWILRIAHPRAPFYFVHAHPASPRSPDRWRSGNQVLRHVAGLLASHPEWSPVILAADLNSSPSGYRSALISQMGLERAKPGSQPAGTFPAGSVWPLKLAIDDVFAGRGVFLRSWEVLPAVGSDHNPVLVELALPSE